MECIVKKLKVVIDNASLDKLVEPIVNTLEVAVGSNADGRSAISSIDFNKISFMVSCEEGLISKYAFITRAGGALFKGASSSNLYMYEPNTKYSFTRDQISDTNWDYSSNKGAGVYIEGGSTNRSGVTGSGTVTVTIWLS